MKARALVTVLGILCILRATGIEPEPCPGSEKVQGEYLCGAFRGGELKDFAVLVQRSLPVCDGETLVNWYYDPDPKSHTFLTHILTGNNRWVITFDTKTKLVIAGAY
jgi:hypothetical protein